MLGTPRGTSPFSPHKARHCHCSHVTDEKTPAQRSLAISGDSTPTVLPWGWVWSTQYQEAGDFSSFWTMKVERRV